MQLVQLEIGAFNMFFLIVDALAAGHTLRKVTLDVIGSGPRAVSGVLEKLGHDVKILPVSRIQGKKDILQRADVLMVSAMTSDIPAARKVLKQWKKYHKNDISIIGGPIALNDYDALIKAGYAISVKGEGEKTLEELLKLIENNNSKIVNDTELSRVEGISFRDSLEKIHINPQRKLLTTEEYNGYMPSIERITDYPFYFAARVYVEILRGCSNFYRPTIPLPDGRACDFCDICRRGPLKARLFCHMNIPPGCGYCSVPAVFGAPRSRKVSKIEEEVEGLLNTGVRRIVLSAPGFLDYGRDFLIRDNPLTDPRKPSPNLDKIEELLSTLTEMPKIKSGNASLLIENLKASLLTEEAAKLISKYLPGTTIHLGCETGSDRHAEQIGRPVLPSEVIKAVRLLNKYNLKAAVYFIHGLPGQTIETAKETVETMNKLYKEGIDKITLYRFQPLPMSAFENFPHAPPAVKNPASKLIYDTVNEINLKLKKQLKGKKMKVIPTEQYKKSKKYLVAYPLEYGPVVILKGSRKLINKVVNVRITREVTPKLVEGEIIR